MAITDSFKNAVSAGDVKRLRVMMKNSLLVDPTFSEFNEMDGLARGVSGLYDETHDGGEIISDKSVWDDNYMNKMMVEVVDNFSHERVDHLKKVVKHLRPVAAPRPRKPYDEAAQSGGKSYQDKRREDMESGRHIEDDRAFKIGAGAVVGGIIGGAVAAVASASVLIGVTLGAVVVGGAVAVATKEEN